VSHKSNQVIKSHDSLSGKTVALVKDYQYTQDIIKSLKGITPYYVENTSDALLAVDNQP
jgi:ABC-type amino acid transport substrate-binding protein